MVYRIDGDARATVEEQLCFGLEELEQRLETAALAAGTETPDSQVCCQCTLHGGCPNIP